MGIFAGGSNFETVTSRLSRNSHETRWIRNRPAKTTPFFRANAKRVGCLLRDAHVLQGKVSQVDTQDTQNEGKEHHHTSRVVFEHPQDCLETNHVIVICRTIV